MRLKNIQNVSLPISSINDSQSLNDHEQNYKMQKACQGKSFNWSIKWKKCHLNWRYNVEEDKGIDKCKIKAK